ncbi:hypothetical protein E8E14_002100 [Neopestalotiopsis sp. 37M]|nr:hypothetical protein E8E14_002100 [Neopestalotiopsis sp. 37M]
MDTNYEIKVFDRPGRQWTDETISQLQDELRQLGSLCLNPLPEYQMFDKSSRRALDDKLIATARENGKIIAAVSAVWLYIPGLQQLILHTGLTLVHPQYRKSGVNIQLFATQWLYVLRLYPKGIWLSTLAEVVSSLVHITKFTMNAYPSPQWSHDNPTGDPSSTHLQIARAISAMHREKMLISPNAVFDEHAFVFRGSNASDQGSAFNKDIDDKTYWHRDIQASRFFRSLLRPHAGDEVLQISFLDPVHARRVLQGQRFASEFGKRAAKVRYRGTGLDMESGQKTDYILSFNDHQDLDNF